MPTIFVSPPFALLVFHGFKTSSLQLANTNLCLSLSSSPHLRESLLHTSSLSPPFALPIFHGFKESENNIFDDSLQVSTSEITL